MHFKALLSLLWSNASKASRK